jgi:hypothetical protein
MAVAVAVLVAAVITAMIMMMAARRRCRLEYTLRVHPVDPQTPSEYTL